jgi:hypothetical protein
MLLLTACGGSAAPDQEEDTEYLVENGYDVQEEERASLDAIKTEYQIPAELQSCHTAIVDGYVIEGHVSVKEIERLLSERPDVIGIAVPGMPVGSPGMEVENFDSEPYNVVTFTASGEIQLFASYP